MTMKKVQYSSLYGIMGGGMTQFFDLPSPVDRDRIEIRNREVTDMLRTQGSYNFKKKKNARRAANKSRRMNRRKK